VDALYILGNGSRWHNNEIRYSIRSLEMYYDDLDRVFVFGKCPDWLDVIHIPWKDLGNRFVNGFKKRREIMKIEDLSDNFLFMADDIFLQAKFEPKLYYMGTMLDKWKGLPKTSRYHEYASTLTGDKLNYCAHQPFPINKQEYLDLLGDIINPLPGQYPKDLYGNNSELWEREELGFNPKCYSKDENELIEHTKGLPFFSTHDDYDWSKLVSFFEELYPEPSKWETDKIEVTTFDDTEKRYIGYPKYKTTK